jgi:hypothetical protein
MSHRIPASQSSQIESSIRAESREKVGRSQYRSVSIFVPINALVVIDDQRAGETGTVEAQLDIIWPTTGTPNSTDALGRPLFSNDWQSVDLLHSSVVEQTCTV